MDTREPRDILQVDNYLSAIFSLRKSLKIKKY